MEHEFTVRLKVKCIPQDETFESKPINRETVAKMLNEIFFGVPPDEERKRWHAERGQPAPERLSIMDWGEYLSFADTQPNDEDNSYPVIEVISVD